jgi:hypothetical protein
MYGARLWRFVGLELGGSARMSAAACTSSPPARADGGASGSGGGAAGIGGRGPALAAVVAISVLVAACSGGQGDSGGNQAPCGAPPGDWQYLSSCDSTVGGLVHQCQDTYATPAAVSGVSASLPGLCSAFSGTLLHSPCSAANSLGSCIITASTGTIAGELVRLNEYAEAGLTVQSFQASCRNQNGTFVLPDGSLPDGGLAGTTASCGTHPIDGGASSGGVAFAIQTVVNGEVVECTNFVGAVTQQQLQSVLSIGAMTSACPTQNAACACTQGAGLGTFGTTATQVYYTTTSDPSASSCSDAGANCTRP